MSANNNRLGFSVIVSIILHLLLIGLLILGSSFTHMIQPAAGGSGGETDTLDAVMVDTAQVAEEYQQLLTQAQNITAHQPESQEQKEVPSSPKEDRPTSEKNIEQEKALEQQKKQEAQKRKAEELRQQELLKKQEETRKKAEEAARLNAEAEAKRLEAAAKQAEEARKAQEAEKQKLLEEQKRIAEAKAKAEKAAKLQAEKVKAEKEAKEKAAKEAKLKAEKEAKAKAKAAAEAKAKAEQQAKNNKALDDFLNGGEINASRQAGNQNRSGSQGKGNAKSVGDGVGNEDRGYENLIKKKLMRFYRVEDNFRGRECRIKLFIERNGRISNYQVLSGPDDICRAATSAIIAAKEVPPAPSDQLYTRYKSPIMQFSLKIQ